MNQSTNPKMMICPSFKRMNSNPTLLPIGYEPTNVDIHCGRGRTCLTHPGNKKFSAAIRNNLQSYVDAPKRVDKSVVVASIVSNFRDNGSKFIRYDKSKQRYIELSDEQAHEKTGHALRDFLRATKKPEPKSRQAADKQKRRKTTSDSKSESTTTTTTNNNAEKVANDTDTECAQPAIIPSNSSSFGGADTNNNGNDASSSQRIELTKNYGNADTSQSTSHSLSAIVVETNVFKTTYPGARIHRTTTTAYRYSLNKHSFEQLSDALFHLYDDEDEMLMETELYNNNKNCSMMTAVPAYTSSSSLSSSLSSSMPAITSSAATTTSQQRVSDALEASRALQQLSQNQKYEQEGEADLSIENTLNDLETPLPLSSENRLEAEELDMINEILSGE